MAIEHASIPDGQRHEPKGASTALNGQVLRANGSGGTSWVNPSTLDNLVFTSILANSKTTNITPSSSDTPLVCSFDSTESNSDVTMDSSGVITVSTSGIYSLTFNLNFGRSNNTGTAKLFARLLVNDSPYGFVQGVTLSDNANVRPTQANLELDLSSADTVKVEIIRDSSGAADGGLVFMDPTLVGWATVPSYWVRIRKLVGAT